MEGDFYIMKENGRSRNLHYIALKLIMKLFGFFKKVSERIVERPTFVLNEADQSSFWSSDLVRKLPKPAPVHKLSSVGSPA